MRRSLLLTCSACAMASAVALGQTAQMPPAGAGAPPPGTLPPQTAPARPVNVQPGVAAGATPAPGAVSGGIVPPSSAGNVAPPGAAANGVGTAGSVGGATSAGSVGGATGTAIGGATGGGPGSVTGAAVGGNTPVQDAQVPQNTLDSTVTTLPVAPPPLVIPAPQTVAPGAATAPGTVTGVGQAVPAQPIENIGAGPTTRRRSSTGTQDDALTTDDHRLLETVRQNVLPRLGFTEEFAPVHFILRNGVVILVGNVASDQQRHQIVSAVQQTPGVVSVVDEMQITAAALGTNTVTATRRDSIVNPSPAITAGELSPTGREQRVPIIDPPPAPGSPATNSPPNR